MTTIYFLYHDPEGFGVAKADGVTAVPVGGPLASYKQAVTKRERLALDADRHALWGTWPAEHERMEEEYRTQLHADTPLPRNCWIVRDVASMKIEQAALIKRYESPQWLIEIVETCVPVDVEVLNDSDHTVEVLDADVQGWPPYNAVVRVTDLCSDEEADYLVLAGDMEVSE